MEDGTIISVAVTDKRTLYPLLFRLVFLEAVCVCVCVCVCVWLYSEISVRTSDLVLRVCQLFV